MPRCDAARSRGPFQVEKRTSLFGCAAPAGVLFLSSPTVSQNLNKPDGNLCVYYS
ncbi:MAG: hypothetical protein QOF74_9142, partial [Caballeronia mineralivorans]|nr:hypothetical protein [Caballeronia mineralivorans]